MLQRNPEFATQSSEETDNSENFGEVAEDDFWDQNLLN